MTLGEFLKYIKHKSLKIKIAYLNLNSDIELFNDIGLFKGTLGEYITSVVKSEINDKTIEIIYPGKENDLDIYIKEETNE